MGWTETPARCNRCVWRDPGRSGFLRIFGDELPVLHRSVHQQGYTNETFGYPQTLMMYDIAAIQHMYGANFNYNGGNTVYKWDPNTGQEFVNGVGQTTPGGQQIFMTVWDGGGNDTYDFSNYTTNLSDQFAARWLDNGFDSAIGISRQRAFAIGNIANALLYQNNPASLIENAIGGSGNDTDHW